jgi:hypothetical protein
MKRTSTQSTTTLRQSTPAAAAKASPRKSTLAFLRQFARAYTYEPRLRPALSEMVAN